ncbi:chaperonin 10-like protein [Cadophora sp. MPI-SDFR-AT-0126]|nr:chaperonin 10-like protein [Leotiomycetes sp. MPI-SDFR-AT-0126]
MSTQKAIQIKGPGDAELVTNAQVPELRDDYIIVKTAAVALNPTDWKHIDFLASPGATVGCDYSGTVEQVGAAVTTGLKIGDRVMGLIHGSNYSNNEDGSFAEYIAAKGDIQIRIPDEMSFEDAATLGVGIVTAGQGLYQSLGLPLPSEPAKEPFPALIYGGSTATGTLAIQLAKLSGLQVITTCSPRSFALVRSMGADYVFDYDSPNCASDMRRVTKDLLGFAFDTVSTQKTANLCSAAIGSGGGKYTSLSPIPSLPRDDVSNASTMAFTAIGESFIMNGIEIPAKPEDHVFAVKWTRLAGDLLFRRKLKPHPAEVRPGGLHGVLGGLQEMRDGKVSGVKLVYSIEGLV